MKNIVLTGGGTCGHIIPNMALVDSLKKSFDNIYYIGSKNGMEKNIVKNYNIPFYEITSTKLIRSLNVKNLSIPFKLIKGVLESKKLLRKLKPDIVFSKGGYVSLPVAIASKSLGIPLLIHESDITLGLTNKLSYKYCNKLLTSFPLSKDEYPKAVFTGSPIRKELFKKTPEKDLLALGLSGKKPILLVLGGSSGSQKINEVLINSIDEILKNFDCIHLAGKGNSNEFLKKKGVVEIEFTLSMSSIFSITDIAISRGGSNTLFELLALKIPSIIIPLPREVSRGDQILNAEYFFKNKIFDYIPQADLNEKILTAKLLNLYKNKKYYQENMENFGANNGLNKIISIINNEITSKKTHS